MPCTNSGGRHNSIIAPRTCASMFIARTVTYYGCTGEYVEEYPAVEIS
jgi:hypothetical protein